VIELAEFFLTRQQFPHTSLDPKVIDLLLKYDWPGNIRELRNVLERAVILSGGEPLSLEEFSLQVEADPLVSGSTGGGTGSGLESTEKEMILAALQKTGNNKTEAARLLKITRRRLYSRMKVHGLKP
jgi:DNA-binding NtrC family response regulator